MRLSFWEKPRGGHFRWILAALASGLIFRLWFFSHQGEVAGDSIVYGDLARNLLLHHVYGFSETTAQGASIVRPTLIRLPGYPLFLAACFAVFGPGKWSAAVLLQIAIDLWTCLLLAGTARRILGDVAGRAALWMAVLCPFMADYATVPLTECPTLFCIALAFYALVRWREVGGGVNRWCLAIGCALGWAILLRPEQGLLAASVVPAMLWLDLRLSSGGGLTWRRICRGTLLVSCLTLLPLVPWTARNWHTFRVFQPLAPKFANDPGEFNPAGFQRWYRTWAIDFASTDQVYWRFDGEEIAVGDLPARAFDSEAQYAQTAALIAEYDRTTTPTRPMDAAFAAIAARRIQAHPIRYYVVLPIARLLNMILRPRVDNLPVPLEWWKFKDHALADAAAALLGIVNLGYLAVACAGLRRRGDWAAWAPVVWAMVVTIGLRCCLLLTIDNSEPRYTLEFYPVLVVLGSRVVGEWVWGARSPTF